MPTLRTSSRTDRADGGQRLADQVGGRGGLQSPTERLDDESVPVRVNERDYLLGSSSSAAKKAKAVLRISSERRNSRFADSRTRNR